MAWWTQRSARISVGSTRATRCPLLLVNSPREQQRQLRTPQNDNFDASRHNSSMTAWISSTALPTGEASLDSAGAVYGLHHSFLKRRWRHNFRAVPDSRRARWYIPLDNVPVVANRPTSFSPGNDLRT